MAQINLEAHVTVAWWLRWYLAGVYMMAITTGAQPDHDKVARMVAKAVTVRFRGA